VSFPDNLDFSFNILKSDDEESITYYAEISDDTGRDMINFASPVDHPEFHRAVLQAIKEEVENKLFELIHIETNRTRAVQ
jgi:hypothetical protein